MEHPSRRGRAAPALQPDSPDGVPPPRQEERIPFAAGAALAAAFASVLALRGLEPGPVPPPAPEDEDVAAASPISSAQPAPDRPAAESSPRPFLLQAPPDEPIGWTETGTQLPPAPRGSPMIERSQRGPRLVSLSSLAGFFRATPARDGFSRLAVAQNDRWESAWMGKTMPRPKPSPGGLPGWARPRPSAAPGFMTGRGLIDQRMAKLFENINTDVAGVWAVSCAAGYGVCTQNAAGQAVYEAGGVRQTQLSYDQSKPLGQRNVYSIEAEGQEAAIVTTSPLVFDLKGDGVRASDRWVRYDLSGNGRYQRFHDIASTNGVLVFDARGAGIAGRNGRELFGDRTALDGSGKATGFADGFEALDALVRAAERRGVLPPGTRARGRLERGDLARLGKAYGLGMRIGSLQAKTVSVEKAGVRSILLSDAPSARTKDFDGQGDDVVRRTGAVFIRADGSSGSYEDVFFRSEQAGFENLALRKTRWDSFKGGIRGRGRN